MKAIHLIKNGSASEAFEIKELPTPEPSENEVLIKVEGFGLNFADVMARLGLYQDAPPMPSVLGYDVCGIIEKCGTAVNDLEPGDRVAALTRFGGYAEYATTKRSGVVKIEGSLNVAEATALATQYGTAWYASKNMANIQEGETVLIHAAAGGVGTALVQIAKNKNCIIYGTAGSDEKLAYLKSIGVDHPINYRTSNWFEILKKQSVKPDIIFDPIGGKSMKQGWKSLAHGGRLTIYGAAQLSDETNFFKKIKYLLDFGFFHPVQFMTGSKSILGINMLRIADHKPHILQEVLEQVVKGVDEGYLKPKTGKIFPVEQIAEAHEYLAGRKSIGKVALQW